MAPPDRPPAAVAVVMALVLLTAAADTAARAGSISAVDGREAFNHRIVRGRHYYPEFKKFNPEQRGAYHFWKEKPAGGYFGCTIPKIACSNWLSYIRTMELPEQLAAVANSAQHKYMQESWPDQGLFFRTWCNVSSVNSAEMRAERKLLRRVMHNPNVFKWAMVRHPWNRVVSGYRSKYEGWCNRSASCMERDFGVPARGAESYSFHGFVDRLSSVPSAQLDPHFRPQYLLCEFQSIQYDFIGDIARPEHTRYISDKLGFAESFDDFSVKAGHGQTSYDDRYYHGQTHKTHACRTHTVVLVEQLYAVDAAILGYTFDDARASCGEWFQSTPPPNAAALTAAERWRTERANREELNYWIGYQSTPLR